MSVAGDRSVLDRAIAEAASPVVIQEYLLDERTEYAAGALVFDGRCDASIVMRRELGEGTHTGRSSTRIPSSIGWSARWPKRWAPRCRQLPIPGTRRPSPSVRDQRSVLRDHASSGLAGFNEVEMALRHLFGRTDRPAGYRIPGRGPPSVGQLFDRTSCWRQLTTRFRLSQESPRDQHIAVIGDVHGNAPASTAHSRRQAPPWHGRSTRAEHPGVWDTAADEVRKTVGGRLPGTAELKALTHLDGVVHGDIAALHTGSDLRRKATRDLWFDGHRTRAGRLLLYSPYVTHRLPELWPEPLQFRPASGILEIRVERGEGLTLQDLSVALLVTTRRSPKAWRRSRGSGSSGAPQLFSSWSGRLERLTATPPARDNSKPEEVVDDIPALAPASEHRQQRLDGFDGQRQGKDSHKHPGRGRGPTEEPDRQAERYEQDDVEAGVAKVEVLGERRQSDAPEIAPAWCRRSATEPTRVGWDRRREHGPHAHDEEERDPALGAQAPCDTASDRECDHGRDGQPR